MSADRHGYKNMATNVSPFNEACFATATSALRLSRSKRRALASFTRKYTAAGVVASRGIPTTLANHLSYQDQPQHSARMTLLTSATASAVKDRAARGCGGKTISSTVGINDSTCALPSIIRRFTLVSALIIISFGHRR